jgi:hypothetical protein
VNPRSASARDVTALVDAVRSLMRAAREGTQALRPWLKAECLYSSYGMRSGPVPMARDDVVRALLEDPDHALAKGLVVSVFFTSSTQALVEVVDVEVHRGGKRPTPIWSITFALQSDGRWLVTEAGSPF